MEANARLDRSPGIPYTATVQNKQVVSGRSTTYRLDLSSWGPKAGTNELDVSSSTYKQIQTGQTVQLNLKDGRSRRAVVLPIRLVIRAPHRA